jgi:hypothetical protein
MKKQPRWKCKYYASAAKEQKNIASEEKYLLVLSFHPHPSPYKKSLNGARPISLVRCFPLVK